MLNSIVTFPLWKPSARIAGIALAAPPKDANALLLSNEIAASSNAAAELHTRENLQMQL